MEKSCSKLELSDYVNDMKNFSNNRPQFSRDHILSTFNLPNIQNLILDIENIEMDLFI